MTLPPAEPGDWTGLALAWQIPDVTPDTPRSDAARKLGHWLLLEMLEQQGPPPGWTETEYREYLEQCLTW